MREIVVLDDIHDEVRNSDAYYALFTRHGYRLGDKEYDLVFHAQEVSDPDEYIKFAGSNLFVRNRLGVIPVLASPDDGAPEDDVKSASYVHKVAGYLYDFSHRFLNRWALRDTHTRIDETVQGETEVEGVFLGFYGLDDISVGKSLSPYDSYLYTSDARLRAESTDITDYLNLERFRDEIDQGFSPN
jgi:hypothetical protein